jgi:hypothetical protein
MHQIHEYWSSFSLAKQPFLTHSLPYKILPDLSIDHPVSSSSDLATLHFYRARSSALHPTPPPPTLKARSLYLCPPGTEWPSYSSRQRFFFSPLSTTRRVKVEVFYPASTRVPYIFSYNIWVIFRIHIFFRSYCGWNWVVLEMNPIQLARMWE